MLGAAIFLPQMRAYFSFQLGRWWRFIQPIVGAFFIAAQAPFIYWLFIYKSWRLDLPNWLWTSAWIAGLSVAVSLTGIALVHGVHALWQRFRRKKSHNSVQLSTNSSEPEASQSRRDFLRSGVTASVGSVSIISAFAAQDVMNPRIEEVTMTFPNLPSGFDGMTIGVLSDIHSSPFMTLPEIQRHKELLQGLGCELLLLPGDFINNRTEEVYPCAEALAGLDAPLGVWAVTGNHDYFSRQIEHVCQEVEQCGVRFLRNANTTIERKGSRLSLLGIDDPFSNSVGKYIADGWTYEKGIESMLSQLHAESFKLLLCHRPYRFEEFAHIGIDCMIAGHTHGGQIVLADFGGWNLSFSSFASPFIAGRYQSKQKKDSQLYVTRGVGSVGIPLRVNCPPEITKISLRRA